MLKGLFAKVTWVGRATTFCVGLAVVLAVVFGIGATALAAVPGDPFKLGRFNQVDRMSALIGDVSGAVLRVEHRGYGPALDLRVGGNPEMLPQNKPMPPMRVDSQAKIANLNADELDGKGAEDFLPAGAKARDSETLDGLDSEQFLRDPGYAPWVKTVADSSRHKKISAPCPPEHMAIGGDARVTATRVPDTDGVPGTGSEVPVALTVVGGAGSSSWAAQAQEMVPFEGDWYLLVEPLCVPKKPEIVLEGGDR